MAPLLSPLPSGVTVADRFYCPEPVVDGRALLSDDEAHHLARVRRLGPGAVVELFDGRGHAFLAEVQRVERRRVELNLVGEPVPDRAASLALTLATAVPKGDRFDWLVEKAAELGVARVVPLITERSVVDPRGAKLDRLRKTIIEASKQCGRNRLMELTAPMPWAELLRHAADPVRLLAHPGGSPPAAWPDLEPGQSVTLAIGPEGGFTAAEADAARAAGWVPVSLGATLLRVETAAVAGAAIVLARADAGARP